MIDSTSTLLTWLPFPRGSWLAADLISSRALVGSPRCSATSTGTPRYTERTAGSPARLERKRRTPAAVITASLPAPRRLRRHRALAPPVRSRSPLTACCLPRSRCAPWCSRSRSPRQPRRPRLPRAPPRGNQLPDICGSAPSASFMAPGDKCLPRRTSPAVRRGGTSEVVDLRVLGEPVDMLVLAVFDRDLAGIQPS